MNYRVISYFRLNPLDITSIVHPLAQNAYMQKLHIRQMLEFDEILLVEQLPPQYGVLDPTGEVRKDVYFTLRCHIGNLIKRHGLKFGKKMRSMGGAHTRTVDSGRPLSEFEKIPPLSASVVEYEKRHTVTKKTIKVSSPTIEEMLVNPELDGISPVNIDPISMLVDDAKTLLEDGVDFVKDPSFGGAAAIAITAIPGKYIDDSASKFIGKYKGKDIELDNVSTNTITYNKRDRESYIQLRKEFDSSIRKNYLKDLSKNDDVINQLTSHGVKRGDIAKLADGKVPKGYQVHHKIPLDDGGTNSVDNLVLIRNSPEHSVFTTYQKQQTSSLTVGSSVVVQWPSPNGSVYPKK